MNTTPYTSYVRRQKGAATLAITLIVLLLITIITLFTARALVTEQKISANQYRAEQAEAAAGAAFEVGVSLAGRVLTGDELRVDRNGDGDSTDNSPAEAILRHVLINPGDHATNPLLPLFDEAAPFAFFVRDSSTGLRVRAGLWYKRIPNSSDSDCDAEIAAELTHPCSANAHNANCEYLGEPAFRVCADGFSDDGTARHRMTAQTGRVDLGGSTRPDIALTAFSSIDLGGNFRVTNFHTNDAVWTGKTVPLQGTPSTRLRNPTDTATATCSPWPCCLQGNNYLSFVTDHMLLTSHPDVGANADIVDNDPNLARLTESDFWGMFFGDTTKTQVEELAKNAGQRYAANSVPSLDGKSGIIWIDGDWSVSSGGTIGTFQYPTILIVNGDFTASGSTINGLVYVTGTFTGQGNMRVNGTMAVEDERPSAGESMPRGSGTLDLCYEPTIGNSEATKSLGTIAIVPGTWRDWNVY